MPIPSQPHPPAAQFASHATQRIHGGACATVAAQFDFSVNSNACGACPEALAAVQQADACRYPDQTYTHVRQQLAQWHAVAPERIVLAASASEWISRFTLWGKLYGKVAQVQVPRHAYADYAHAARCLGLSVTVLPSWPASLSESLCWLCQPSSPLGQLEAIPPASALPRHTVLDCAYAPLCIDMRGMHDMAQMTAGRHAPHADIAPSLQLASAQASADTPPTHPTHHATDTAAMLAGLHRQHPHIWHLFTPNKALGLTGVRAAYAIAPTHISADEVATLNALAPSWVLGAHGVALLNAWVSDAVQHWLHKSHHTLRQWKLQQIALLQQLGWQCSPSVTSFFCARPAQPFTAAQHAALAAHGVQLRDCTSFGLPGWWRLAVLTPAAQTALHTALRP